jgi:hypothetical protein
MGNMQSWQLSWQLYLMLFVAMVGVPVFAGSVAYYVNTRLLKPLLWWVLFCTSAFLWTAWWLSHNQIDVSGNSMTLRAGFYQTVIDDYAQASRDVEVRPLHELGDFKPNVAVNGINLPEYQVGWYLLENRKLAFVMLIGHTEQVSVIKTASMTAILGGNIRKENLSRHN